MCFGESVNALNVESRATLVRGKVAQRITVLAINNLQVHNIVVSFSLDLIDAVCDTLLLVFGTLFFELNLAFYNVVLVEENDVVVVLGPNSCVELFGSQLSDVVFDNSISRGLSAFSICRLRDMNFDLSILEDIDLFLLLIALLPRVVAEGANQSEFSVEK